MELILNLLQPEAILCGEGSMRTFTVYLAEPYARNFFSHQGFGSIAVLPGTMTAGRYQQVLEDHLLPVAHQWFPGGDWTFIQDNAPCHKSFSTQAFMAQKRILCMDWPPYSPD